MDRKPVAGVLSWEVFGQKHSDVSFTYWRTVLEIKNEKNKNKKLISPPLERQVFVSNFQAMLLSRTQHKPAPEYKTYSHCDTKLTWEKNYRIGQ